MKVERMVGGAGQVVWLISRPNVGVNPHVLMTDSEMDVLLDEVERQRPPQRRPAELQIDGTLRLLRAVQDPVARLACQTAEHLLLAAASGTPLYTAEEETR